MPVKKDASGKRWVEIEFIAPGGPEQVWAAIATGPGNSSWFAPTEIEERVGGRIAFSFGEGVCSSGSVTVWEPPHRFGYEERGWSGEAPPLATEIVIESRAGGQCVVRMVHSLFASSDEWDDQMEGFEQGWPVFIEVLRLYLSEFAGKRGASLRAMSPCPGGAAGAWKLLAGALGLSGAEVGERRAAPPEAPPFSGLVEIVRQNAQARQVTLRLDRPGPGLAVIGVHPYEGRAFASVSLFLYGDDAADLAARHQPQWRDWLARMCAATGG